MKILVVSDTHRQNDNYFKVLKMHQPDLLIHCGDIEGSEEELIKAADCPVKMVLGESRNFLSESTECG